MAKAILFCGSLICPYQGDAIIPVVYERAQPKPIGKAQVQAASWSAHERPPSELCRICGGTSLKHAAARKAINWLTFHKIRWTNPSSCMLTSGAVL